MKVEMRRQDVVKLSVLIALVMVLTFFSDYKVTMSTIPSGFATLPDSVRDEVSVTSFNGQAKTAVTNIESYVMPVPDTFSTWDAETGITLAHTNVASSGCQSVFTDNIDVNLTVTNGLSEAARGAINISIYNQKTGDLLDSKVLMLSFMPGQAAYAAARFSLSTQEIQPIFLVKANFPEGQGTVSANTKQVSLLEFLLMQAGILQH